MHGSQQLALVKDQAEKKQSKLSESVKKIASFVEVERNQLLQLQNYEADYLKKIQQEQSRWTAKNSQRYRHFYLQLSQTIKIQQEKVVLAEQQLQSVRQSLFQQYQRINVLKKLIEEKQLQSVQLENQLSQKEMDDLSNRHYFR